jgi:transcriptional regulator with XRE-family HTH domain
LREWRKIQHLKGYELAKIIHISQGSMSDIENNNSLPSAETIAKLYQHTQINIIWLLTGKGQMNRSQAGLDEEATESQGLDQNLKDMLEKVIRIYQRGEPDKRAHLKGFLMGADPGDE